MRHQLAIALLFAATACTTDNTPSASDVTSDLERANGGFDTSDEAPMFGQQDQFEAAAIEKDAPTVDPMASDPTIADLTTSPTAARHRVLIAWGKMPADPTSTEVRDWGGSLTLSRGGMIVRRTVGFEAATDHLNPRTSPSVVSFASMTRPFADGLLLGVLDPEPTSTAALTLTYHEDSTNQDYAIDLSQLAAGPLSIDAGNGYRIIAVGIREHEGCEHGFLRGRWLALREHAGVYRGMIANADGEVTGHIRGIWGEKQDGTKVMFGKFIATDGSFRGIIAGTYDAGHFHARWLTAAGDHGQLGGVYMDSPNVRGGVFAGRWADAACAN